MLRYAISFLAFVIMFALMYVTPTQAGDSGPYCLDGCYPKTICRTKGAVCLCGYTVNRPHPYGTHTEIVDCIFPDHGATLDDDDDDDFVKPHADCDRGFGVLIPQTVCFTKCVCRGGDDDDDFGLEE